MTKMKESGFPWIGVIPESWDIRPVKSAFYRKNEKAQQKKPVVLSLARSGVRIRDIEQNEGQLAKSYYNYNPVKYGDLLINPMDLYSGANCNMSEVEGVISPAYINLRAKLEIDSKFYDYYFKTQYWSMAFFAHGLGVSYENRWTLNNETLQNYKIPVPSYNEQIKLRKFLNNKVELIDKIIDKNNYSVEMYNAYLQSLIHEVVTKGLNHNITRVSSGIDWIGDYPKHWDLIKMVRIIEHTQNGLSRRELSKSNGEIVLKLKNIKKNGIIDYSEMNRIELSENEKKQYQLSNNDFLFVRVNGSKSLVGKCAIYKDNNEVTAFNDHIIRVKFSDKCLVEYIHWFLLSEAGRGEIGMYINTAAGQFTISGQGLRAIRVLFPPLDEQKEISDYLSKISSEIGTIIDKKLKLINSLKSYKKSLIYEVVTGKRDIQ